MIVLILVAGLAGWWYIRQINPPGDVGEPVSFTVDPADTLETLSERLEAEGLIVDAGVFRWYVERHGGLEITPGYYELAPSDHMGNVLGRLRTPPEQTYTKVTFPEGFTVAQIAARVERDMATMTAADFLAAAADPAVSPACARPASRRSRACCSPTPTRSPTARARPRSIARMIAQMERVTNQEDIVTKGERFGQSPYGILTIASLIEREAKTDEDRAKIARVIYNRLAIGMPLAHRRQRAATARRRPAWIRNRRHTVQRAAGACPGRRTPTSTRACRRRRSPTRAGRRSGPPSTRRRTRASATRCAPGCPRASPCQYLYYVLANEDGSHAFAVTPEQHQANVDAAAAAGLLD